MRCGTHSRVVVRRQFRVGTSRVLAIGVEYLESSALSNEFIIGSSTMPAHNRGRRRIGTKSCYTSLKS